MRVAGGAAPSTTRLRSGGKPSRCGMTARRLAGEPTFSRGRSGFGFIAGSFREGGWYGTGQAEAGGGGGAGRPRPARGDQVVVPPARTRASACSLTGRSFGWPFAAARRAALRAAYPVCRVSKAIEAAISTARRVTRPRGSPLDVAAQASAVKSSARTVTRSPFRTEAAVREARSPNAVTLTQRVMLSPEPRAGMSRARRSSTPSVPSRVVKLRGSSPRRPVTVTLIGFMGFLLVRGPGGSAALVAAWGLGGPSRRSGGSAVQEGPAHRPAGRPRCFPAGTRRGSAGAAGTRRPRPGERSLAARTHV